MFALLARVLWLCIFWSGVCLVVPFLFILDVSYVPALTVGVEDDPVVVVHDGVH